MSLISDIANARARRRPTPIRPYLVADNTNPAYAKNGDTDAAWLDGYMAAGKEYGEAAETRHEMIREQAFGEGVGMGSVGMFTLCAMFMVALYLLPAL